MRSQISQNTKVGYVIGGEGEQECSGGAGVVPGKMGICETLGVDGF